MSLCVVCCSLANVFCNQDQAFLCKACDTTIHSANIISRGHKRVPVCELCKRSAATVFCQQDEAFLCGLCEGEVHSALPPCLPHTVVPVDQALAQRAGAHQLQTPAPAAAAEDACSEHCGERPEQSSSQAPGSQSNDSSSLARVPDMVPGGLEVPAYGVLPAGDAPLKASWGKDIEALDIDAAWLSGFDAAGFDFSDILGVPDIPMPDDGLVPAAVPPPADDLLSLPPAKQQQQQSMLGSHSAHASNTMPTLPMMMMVPAEDLLAGVDADDFVVPSFLPDDEEEAECLDLMPHASTAATHKRSAADFLSTNPAAAMPPAAKRQQQHHHMEMSAAYTPAAPVPPPAARPAATPAMPPSAPAAPAPVKAEAEPHKYSSAAQQAAYLMNGANLTREQRVARYREKRKNRKFHKTIRYASRKAYAEVRPRIKGRFATKEEVEAWKMQKAQGLIPQDAPCMPLS